MTKIIMVALIKPGLMMPDDLQPIAGGYEIRLSEMCPVVDGLVAVSAL